MYSKKGFIYVMMGIMATLNYGCAPVAVVGGGAAVTFSAAEERGIKGVYDDAKIKSKIYWVYQRHADGLFGVVHVVVRQGRVLLTGTVNDPMKKVEAVKLAWTVQGVSEVKDEIKFGQDSLFDFAKDSLISAKIKSKLVFNEHVHSINFNIQTIDQVVYIMGVARSEEELERVLEIARTTNNVREVVNYAIIGKKV